MTILIFALLSALIYLVLGFLWYSIIFQNAWMRYTGFTDQDTTKGWVMISQLAGTFALGLLYGVGLWFVFDLTSDIWMTVLGLWGLLLVPALTGSMIWARFRLGFWLLETGYRGAFLALATLLYVMMA
jgi:uncharacterized membrane protein (DUF485 family)